VNLFIPSILTWEEKGLTVRQTTRFPDEDTTRLAFSVNQPVNATLNIRYPSWSGPASVTINGQPVQVSSGPGSYITISREWRSGDVLEARMPMSLRSESLPGDPRSVAFLYGPIVLAGRLGREGLYPGADILRNERTSGMILDVPVEVPVLRADPERVLDFLRPASGAEPLTFETVGIGDPGDVTLIPYFRLHHERYNLYWKVEPRV
jgi:DUF1680 family protein